MGTRVSLSFYVVHALLVVFSFSMQLVVPKFLGNETDRIALLEFKSKIIDGHQSVLDSWNESVHFCQWHGVTCGRRHQQRVTILDLGSHKLAGSISPYIGNLSFLKILNLRNNSFTHEIPLEIGFLRRLLVLALNNNSIGGEIPSNISSCSNLIRIRLYFNQLVGTIPSELGSLSKTQFFAVSGNKLTGSIPSSLGNLSSIRELSFSSNYLDGSIPDTFGRLTNLMLLYLSVNRLSGTIPSSIFNISSIKEFDAGYNQIQGILPLDIGFTLPNLQFFSISSNQITGAIPPSISNASKLQDFEVIENKLTGEVPSFGKLQKLFWLLLGVNNLGSGGRDDLKFLCSLTNATNLEILGINSNNFGGLLPGCISNFSTTLQMLFLDNNKIYGSIPTAIGKFVKMQRLDLWNNQLSGNIPSAIGELQNLKILYLPGNKLSGNIPFLIGKLKMLIELDLSDNFLQGSIPSSFGQCVSLVAVNLSNNNLSGTITPQLIGLPSLSIYLDLSRNQLTGNLPTEVGNLKNLKEMEVSGNMLEGEIPGTLGSCNSLEKLAMQDNLFRGSIPSSLSSLRGLVVLDFSQNNLSGKIPKFLANFKLLKILNLSYNDLEGMVPLEGIFKNSSGTSVMGNGKLCGGIPELQLPKCTKNNSSSQKISRRLKVIISVVSAFAALFSVSFFIFCWLKRRKELRKQPSEPVLRKALQKVSYDSLLKATDGFSSTHLIGVGSFGSVYKGIFDQDGTVVAIKVFNLQHRAAFKSFTAECKILRSIRHRNLVKVITSCSSIDFQGNDFKALVYNYMPNGSLEKWLYADAVPQTDEEIEVHNLTLLQRISISIDVASAVDYLHHHCQEPILHCDLKPSNILLDNDLTAHVGDFGLSKFHQEISSPNQSSSVGVRGTIGYAAPEYGLGSEVSTNGDVYSYGILLLEMVTKKKPTDIMFEGDLNLHNFARLALPDHVKDIVDPILLNDDEALVATTRWSRQPRVNSVIECLISMVQIGVACSMESPQDRMNITSVINELQSIRKALFEPKTMLNNQRDNRDN